MTNVAPEFDLVDYARSVNAKTNVPSYDDLQNSTRPGFEVFVDGFRDRVREHKKEGKRIFVVIGTGGTFQSAKGENGYEPSGTLAESFEALQLPKDNTIHIEMVDLMNLDSSQMTIEQWRFLAEMIMHLEEKAGDMYDGIIVTHGTDTMAKGASYLSYMLKGFPKSIVFTGSQHPAREAGSDAKDHMERAITTLRLASNPNRLITEVMVACGPKVTRATWAAKQGDTTTHAFGPWNEPRQVYDSTDWARANQERRLHVLAPALLDFGLGKSAGELQFAAHAIERIKKGQYEPFTEIVEHADVYPVRLSDKSLGSLARHLIRHRVSLLVQLGAATADDNLVDLALKSADLGKLIVVQSPFPDSTVRAGMYKAGAAIARVLGCGINRPLPVINTSPDALDAKINWAYHRLGLSPNSRTEGLGDTFCPNDIRRFYDLMEQQVGGDLV